MQKFYLETTSIKSKIVNGNLLWFFLVLESHIQNFFYLLIILFSHILF